jgi:Zn-dependent protease
LETLTKAQRMYGIFSNIGPSLPFMMILLAMLGLRSRVTPKTNVLIKATPEEIWPQVNIYDGKVENWGNTVITTKLLDPASGLFEKTYVTKQLNGVLRTSIAQFSVVKSTQNQNIVLQREGIDGQSTNNELLKITHSLEPQGDSTRLKTVYYWGPRPLIAQLLARADLWSGAFRLKGLVETGVPNERPYHLISAGVALVIGLLSIGAFAMILGFRPALLLILALFVHEFGHLLAYRLIGQPWGRMVFLPFLGALAMPRLPFESQGQSIFTALMGPGFSIILALACMLPVLLYGTIYPVLVILGLITAALNLFNLLPAEPLDGGVALRSVLANLIGANAHRGLMAIGLSIMAIGIYYEQLAVLIFGGLAVLANIKPRKIDAGQTPLTSLQLCISAFAYVAIAAGHITLLNLFYAQLTYLSAI